jgi:guanylate kinase
MPTPKLIVISAPSGCGKTTIARAILSRHPELLFSVSATTREKRNGEVEGKDYYFLTKQQFEEKIRNNELIEWEIIYDNYYGTPKSEIERSFRTGRSMMFDIDVNGALTVKSKYPKDSVLIFIAPPSFEVLSERLRKRKTEREEILQKRLQRVSMELEKAKEFDYQVVNDDLMKAIEDVDTIIVKATQE